MPSDKKRLYVALYPSGILNNPDRKYHWDFIIGPKEEIRGQGKRNTESHAGIRCHVKPRIANAPGGEWYYEERPLDDAQTSVQLLARIVVAKVEDEQRLLKIIRTAPVTSGDSNWRCRTWVAYILQKLKDDGKAVGRSELDWARIEAFGRQYVASKNASMRYNSEALILGPKPTYDLVENKEIMP